MRTRVVWFTLGMVLAGGMLAGVYHIPAVKFRLEWRLDAAAGIVRGWLHPGAQLPVMGEAEFIPPTPRPSPLPQPTPTGIPWARTPSPTPLPAQVQLPAPAWEKQDWNNCGPATLALALRTFGWGGDQFDISDRVKPDRGDKNVNIDELVYFVRNHAGWLAADFRVGGTIDTLKRFLAAGLPVIVEKGYLIESDGPDNGWAGHYMLLTGYNDTDRRFTGQDTFLGPDQVIRYDELEQAWQAFNHVYMYVYPLDQPPDLAAILGDDLDPDGNRQKAIEQARLAIDSNPENAFAWFNLGTNLVYFEQYAEAAGAFDTAFSLGLPWRFTRYQFGPYIAYFHAGRTEDVMKLADATLERTAEAEESLLWRGWARYRLGDTRGAVGDFEAALKINPNYLDAQYALDYLGL
ncbi:MAG: tetratricopeptide repeat protein [Anaerolineales bacterium]